jgi:hypothetical protein
VPAQVLDGGVAVVGVHPEREPLAVGDRLPPARVRVRADAEVRPPEVKGHVAGLALGRELVGDFEAEQVAVEADRPRQVAGGQDREDLLEHRPSWS